MNATRQIQATPTSPYNVLFLCRHNAARSLMAEALLHRWGGERFEAFSAGSQPAETIDPHTLAALARAGLPSEGLSPKNWHDFTAPDAPVIDFIFVLCDQIHEEEPPLWPGHPVTARWNFSDPQAFQGTPAQTQHHYDETLLQLQRSIEILLELPLRSIDHLSAQTHLALASPQPPTSTQP